MNLNETIICYKKIAEANRDSYVCLLETSYQNQMQNKAIMDRHKRKAEEYEQLAEWLEELKALKQTTQMVDKSNFSQDQYKADADTAYQCGYTKAIEDFADKVEFVVGAEDRDIYCKEIVKEVAEQLKEGDVDNG